MYENIFIRTKPAKCLRTKAIAVENNRYTRKDIADALLKAAEQHKGCQGVSCPQIGLNKRAMVIIYKGNATFMFNPEIIKKSRFKKWSAETCLSDPKRIFGVRRSRWLICRYEDIQGEQHEIKYRFRVAKIVEHEMNHLEGLLPGDVGVEVRRL